MIKIIKKVRELNKNEYNIVYNYSLDKTVKEYRFNNENNKAIIDEYFQNIKKGVIKLLKENKETKISTSIKIRFKRLSLDGDEVQKCDAFFNSKKRSIYKRFIF